MVQVIKGRNFGSALGQALGTLGGAYVGGKYREGQEEEKRKKMAEEEREKEQTRMADMLQRYEDFSNNPAYQNLPLDQKMTLASVIFGKDVGGLIGKAEELRLKQQELTKPKDEKPALTLNEELNQLDKRTKERIKDLSRPFEKRDAFGNVFLDFEEDDKKRAKTLGKISKELKAKAKEEERLYRLYGRPVPEDIQKQMMQDITVDINGMKVPLGVIESAEEFEKKFPPKKHKGKRAKDDSGFILESDGERWNIVGFEEI